MISAESRVFGVIDDVIVLARLSCLLAHRFVCVSALAGLILLTGVARGDVEQWSSIGPNGGTVFALVVDPHVPATIYAGTSGGVFKTMDGGGRWAPASLGMPVAGVFALAIDPTTPSTLYAGTKGLGVFKSVDGAASWTAANTGLAATVVFAFAIDPKSPSTIYAGTDSGVFKSTDGAASWKAAGAGIGAQPVIALAIDPVTPSTLYAGTKKSGVFRSSDGAASWTAASSGLTRNLITCLAVDPKTPSTIYAGTFLEIFKSTDGAASWAYGGLGNNLGPGILALAIDPATPSTIYAGTGSGDVFKSMDSGRGSWQPVDLGLPRQPVNVLAIDPSSPETVYAGTQGGLFKSTNKGGGWTAANTGLAATKVFALALDPAAPSTVYAGTDLGLFKSVDGGTSWIRLINVLGETPVWALTVLPVFPSTVLAGTDGGAFKSTDGGANWTQGMGFSFAFAFAIDPASPSTVYEGGRAGGPGDPPAGTVSKSTDAGSTWANFGISPVALPVVNAVRVDPTSPETVYIGTDAGVYKTLRRADGTLHWETNNALATRRVFTLAIDPASASTVWAGTDGGLSRSTDGGVSWTPVTNGLTATGIYALLFDPASPSTFYAGTSGGVFKSTDRGASWMALSQGLTNVVVNAFAIAPTSPQTFYAGTSGGSAFRFPTRPPAADFTWAANPVAGQPVGFTDRSTGLPTSWSWTFGDGGSSTIQNPTHTYAAAGSYQASLTATNAGGSNAKTQTITVNPALAGNTVTKVVPIVLDVSGVGGARFGSELTLANRGTTASTLQITYFAATSLGASGSGTVTETLGPGRQVVFADAMVYLRSKGLAIPTGSNQGGALFVTFGGLSSPDVAFAGARTTAPSGGGRAGLAYPGIRLEDGLTGKAFLFGLRENPADRSNLALLNMNNAAPIALRVTLVSGADGQTSILPDFITLEAGQWTQLGHVLSGPGFASGFATVELVSGPGPFYTYAVFNDNTTADGSFVPPMTFENTPEESPVQLLPVLVETGTFQSELVLTSPFNQSMVATMTYVESLTPSGGAGGVASETLRPFEQKIIPGAVDYLRGKGISIGAQGAGLYAGAVRITFTSGGHPSNGFAGARTEAPANGGGQYGLFYRASRFSETVSDEAWVFGLQQNSTNRSNLAVVSAGNGSSVTYRLDVYNGDTGQLAGSSPPQNLPVAGWFQFSPVLPKYGISNGYVRVVRLSGSSHILAYGVVNDGATSGSGATNDGSFVAFSNR